jgi:pyruvate/2-oxoglutarate dehydrogenase complex dihydrolipoamide acyltransferase (E2) component
MDGTNDAHAQRIVRAQQRAQSIHSLEVTRPWWASGAVKVDRMAELRGWRRVATAMWEPPNDPQIYGALDVDARNAQRFIADAEANGQHITATHLVGRAVSHALRKVPDLNVRIVGTAFEPAFGSVQ